ncbi:hypothetical protein, partial [Parolsenella catena]|uniref:hypothetical protein n=1 Tax=Parolsenella catena TaxID=2003188 RepID=UPI001E3397FB
GIGFPHSSAHVRMNVGGVRIKLIIKDETMPLQAVKGYRHISMDKVIKCRERATVFCPALSVGQKIAATS